MRIDKQSIVYPKTLPERIRWHRQHMGWSLSNVPGFSHTTMWKYETGQRAPTPKRLSKLAQLFGVPVETLTGGELQTTPVIRSTYHGLEQAQTLLTQEEFAQAYEMALTVSRLARALGDTEGIESAGVLVKAALNGLSLPEILDHAVKDTPLELLEEVAHYFHNKAFSWTLMLHLTEILLRRGYPEQANYGKWMRNRARVWYELGEFALSEEWYEKAPCGPPYTGYTVCVMARISIAEMRVFQSMRPPHLDNVSAFFATSRLIWELYWGMRYHEAYEHGDWAGLDTIYRQAMDTSDASWAPSPQVSLAGLKALVDGTRGSPEGIALLESILDILYRNPAETVDRRIREELTQDYVRAAIMADLPQASVVWATHVAKMVAEERMGWVRYWLVHAPSMVAWDTIPRPTQSIVQRAMENPPEPLSDPLLDEILRHTDDEL